jgi:hypothetical protein
VLTPAGLVVALVLSAPALWDAANGSLGMGTALVRLLAALAAVAVATAVLRKIMEPQPARVPVDEDSRAGGAHPARRREDG